MMMDEQACHFCRCTDRRACQGGCFWIKQGYCSACYDQHMEELIKAFMHWRAQIANPPAKMPALIGTFACTITTSDEAIFITDHIGAIAFRMDEEGAYVAPQYEPLEIAAIFAPRSRKAA